MSRIKGQRRFSPEVQDAVFHSRQEAMRLGCSYIDSHHLFMGMLCAENNSAVEALRVLGVDFTALKETLDTHCRVGPPIDTQENMPLTVIAERALKQAYREAIATRSTTIDAVHLLLGLLRAKKGGIAQFMKTWGISHERIRMLPTIRYSRVRFLCSGFVPGW